MGCGGSKQMHGPSQNNSSQNTALSLSQTLSVENVGQREIVRQEDRVRKSLSEEQWKQALLSSLKSGGIKLGMGKMNICGPGRAGKSALVNSLSGKKFEDTASTIGVEQSLMRLGKVTLTMGGGNQWQIAEGNGMVGAAEAQARLAVQIAYQDTEASRIGSEDKHVNIFDVLRKPEDFGFGHDVKEVERELFNSSTLGSQEAREVEDEGTGSLSAGVLGQSPAMTHLDLRNEEAVRLEQEASNQIGPDGSVGIESESKNTKARVEETAVRAVETHVEVEMDSEEETRQEEEENAELSNQQQQESSQPPPLPPEEMKKLKDIAMSLIDDTVSDKSERLKLLIWDFGGQKEFLPLHNLFLNRMALFVIVFNMQDLLPSAPLEQKQQSLAFLSSWFDAVSVHTVDSRDGSTAPVVLVGTHKDKVPNPSDHEAISLFLHKELSSKRAWRGGILSFKDGTVSTGLGLLWFFPVDNTSSSSDENIRKLQVLIQNVILKETYVNATIPFSWLQVVEKLQELGADGVYSVSLTEFQDMCRKCNMPSTPEITLEDEALAVLQYMGDLGFLLYNTDDSLRHLVILDPLKFFIEPTSRVMAVPEMHEDDFTRAARQNEWMSYGKLKYGLLHPNLLNYFWLDRLPYVKEMEALSVKLGVFVPIFTGTPEIAENRQFLVPAHLPKVLSTTTRNCHEDQLVAYLVFASPEIMQQWRRKDKGYIPVTEAKEDGFSPSSFFVSLVGQLVAHSQCVFDMSYDDMELSQSEVIISFLKHKFCMREMPEVHMFQIVIQVETSLLIVDTILSVAAKTLASMTMAQGVRVAMAVPADGGKLTAGLTADGQKPRPSGHLVIINGEGGLQQRLDSNTSVALGPGADRRRSPLEARHIFAAWLLPTGFRLTYDVFFSYRWNQFDTEIMHGIFSIMSSVLLGPHRRQVQPFLDRQRLQDGQNFSDEFSSALINSSGVVPVVSSAALERMVSLTSDSPVDNLGLEWLLILEIKEKKQREGKVFFVLPVVAGKVSAERKLSNGSFSSSLFEEGIIQQLPQVVWKKTVAKAKTILIKNGITPSANLETRTVRQVVEEITAYLGVMANDVKSRHGLGGSVEAASGHEWSLWKSALLAELCNKVVACLEAAEITLGDVRQRQEPMAEAKRRKEEETSRLLGEFGLSNEDLSKIAAADIKTVADLTLLEPEDVEAFAMSLVSRKKFTKLLEHVGAPAFLAAPAEQKRRAEARRQEEENRIQQEAKAQAAAARRGEEAKLRKLLGEFGLSNEDELSKIAAADIRIVADLALLEQEDVEAFAMSLVSRKKFTKLLEHVGAPAFLAAATKKKQQAEMEAAAALQATAAAAAATEQKRKEEERVAKAAAAAAAEAAAEEARRVATEASAAVARLKTLEAQGDVTALIKVMLTLPEQQAVQQVACQALENLARDDDGMRVKIAAAGGIVAVVAALKAHTTSALLQEQACRALRNLTVNPDNQVAVAAAGGIVVVIAAMKAHTTSAGVQENACGALSNLTVNKDNQVAVAAAGGVEAVIVAMQAHKTSAIVQEKACWALRNLTGNNDNQVAVAAAGGIVAVVGAMTEHKTSAGLQEDACGALLNLAGNSDNDVAVSAAGGIEALATAMKTHQVSALLQEDACGALNNLARNASLRERIKAAGGVELAKRAVSASDATANTKRYVNRLLDKLA